MTAPVMYSIKGRVIGGDKVGRTIGFPTANLDVQLSAEDLKPGVYAGQCSFTVQADEHYDCVAYFGPRLIFGEQKNSFEVFILGLSKEIYGQELLVRLLHYVREPLPFTSLAELQRQLQIDTQTSQKLLAGN